jgi:hypothetical protein
MVRSVDRLSAGVDVCRHFATIVLPCSPYVARRNSTDFGKLLHFFLVAKQSEKRLPKIGVRQTPFTCHCVTPSGRRLMGAVPYVISVSSIVTVKKILY